MPASRRGPIIEDVSNSGPADIVVTGLATTHIFETKYEEGNDENALDQCHKNYVLKHIFLMKRKVVCHGLQFSKEGDIIKWGVSVFSEKGDLVEGHGPEDEGKRNHLPKRWT